MAGAWFTKLVALQERLYAPGGCPWDREQTHQSLRKYLVEECYEVLDAMESGQPRKFADELGDLLLQVIFHSVIAAEENRFTVSDVIEAIHSKMVRRHPHVFGDTTAKTSAAVLKKWEEIKAEERLAERQGPEPSVSNAPAFESVLSAVPRSLPAVLEAYQLSRRAAHVGFDWDSLAEIMNKLDEEKHEILRAAKDVKANASSQVATEEEIGDLFFVVVNIARHLGVDPEIALKKANRKFKERFTCMESMAHAEGKALADVPRRQMEDLWDLSKR